MIYLTSVLIRSSPHLHYEHLYTDWNMTDYGAPDISEEDRSLTLPLTMRYLCPPVVTFIGLGAVSAAVMSSTDSSILSSSTMFSRNVFGVLYKRFTKREVRFLVFCTKDLLRER